MNPQALAHLSALRAFEAAARHMSFTRASEELHVTPAAISHHIRQLEDWLGTKLFVRKPRAVELTQAGQALLPGVRDGLGQLAGAVERVRRRGDRRQLVISMAPSFAAKWLVPRLEGFRRICPEVDVRIDSNSRVIDFARDGVDIAIRYGDGAYPDFVVEPLVPYRNFPVCSPQLLEDGPPLRVPADLARHTLLHVHWLSGDATSPEWAMWLKAAGAEEVDWSRGPVFNDEANAVAAALAGQGVALVNGVLVGDDLSSGRLVRPFELELAHDGYGYWLVIPPALMEEAPVKAFHDWLLTEVERSTALPGSCVAAV
ncbi:transcriptional regulator GcvA [Kaustia mangrovi]|uniref:Transcriptional regulator GcvA n=1 Tax=Kaustia mangrovi TaxID=2593653 RepID=A0A7S8HBY6_9HYPH|nr:transcriptional regulator GcvA [Kaustia mangrovi]QPC43080.1 transcriptional regulator GcvA [Kaustia mangrovi]